MVAKQAEHCTATDNPGSVRILLVHAVHWPHDNRRYPNILKQRTWIAQNQQSTTFTIGALARSSARLTSRRGLSRASKKSSTRLLKTRRATNCDFHRTSSWAILHMVSRESSFRFRRAWRVRIPARFGALRIPLTTPAWTGYRYSCLETPVVLARPVSERWVPLITLPAALRLLAGWVVSWTRSSGSVLSSSLWPCYRAFPEWGSAPAWCTPSANRLHSWATHS